MSVSGQTSASESPGNGNGQAVGFTPPTEGREQTTCRNPATGEVVGYSALHGLEDVRVAIEEARVAQVEWAKLPVKARANAMLRIRDYITENADELAETISRDNGKTRVDALVAEVVPAAMAIHYYAKKAESLLEDRKLKPASILFANKASKIVRVPFGVLGIISPWNYPFSIPFAEVVMGLLAGNAVILKTATQTQMAGRALERCVMAAGLPKGVFSFLNLPGRLAGSALLEAGIDKLFFTGSVPVGKTLMAKAAETLTPVSLELGGNDAMLVCPDADIERAAAGAAWAGLQNCGQSCGGVERIYVHKDVYQKFIDLLADKVRVLRVGFDADFDVDLGAMTTTGQMQTVRAHVADALEKGAYVYAESSCPTDAKGNFLPAMILSEVDHSMQMMKEETFGPIIGVMKVGDMSRAVELANDSNLGLTGSVWSKDKRLAESLARRIRAGTVTINDHTMSHGLAETPWGGFKESGIGRTHGDIGFAEMTEPQCIIHDHLPGVRKNMWWYPHSRELFDGFRGILDLLYARQAGRRVKGLRKFLKIFPRTFSV